MDRPAVRDTALLLLRAVLAAVFISHGVQRLFTRGVTASTREFAVLGIPQPKLSVYLVGVTEILGGVLLLIGLLTTVVAGLLALLVLLAGYFVHLPNGFFVANGGAEYVLVLAMALIMIVVFGSGRASVDGALVSD
ncbi:DoxX family protein [Corynebacterium aquatimens]|uniref:Oxidoreductase n=1 Tax=Corynebacterium aquatimens TaxID=1190508 RepID=A0A931E260_9CORY|nr:DoxX family protein [Corynebacterium aquatimens]MBG6121143.1 putative oxidoreductase [Corynebacterium aquatimens]WJY66302.1 Putative oxidoreductase MhqP [Corynebacterium aquatimens]